jgi:predicted O-linked N-acetylglucosamine transferase (SPINDLY family)
LPEAIACYRRAVELHPGFAEALYSQGNAWRTLGNLEEAVSCYRRAIEVRPGYAEAHNNLGAASYAQGNLAQAAVCFQTAIGLQPDNSATLRNLGLLHHHQARLAEAAACYHRALALDGDFAEAAAGLAAVYRDQGRHEEAGAFYRRALAIRPSESMQFALATLLPVIYHSAEHVSAAREELLRKVSAMAESGVRLDPSRDVVDPSFYLAYQGGNDREIQERIGRLWATAAAPREAPPVPRPAGAKVRIGFVSRFFRDHTVGHLWRGLIARLSRRDFDVHVFAIGQADDKIAEFIRRAADHYHPLPLELDGARRLVAREEMDILVYTDVGMDGLTGSLAASRLAPIQAATWGHPVTTGLATIDYFISTALAEPADAEQHYSERLVRLDGLGVYLYRPAAAAKKTRADFGLPEDRHLYACLQSPFKLHPDDDRVWAEILRADAQGQLLLLSGLDPHATTLLRKRLAASMPQAVDRVVFLPRLSGADYLALVDLVDVLLDPLHFSGGRTSCEAFAAGQPVVTMPSAYLRGRITYALYLAMGVLDCVADSREEYVRIALRLAGDWRHRQTIREKIRTASERLFEDPRAVLQQEEMFLEWMSRKRSS